MWVKDIRYDQRRENETIIIVKSAIYNGNIEDVFSKYKDFYSSML